MGAKDLIVRVIPPSTANKFVKAHHYSGKVVPNSKLHFGVFIGGGLHGVMSFGPPMDKSKVIRLVVDENGDPAPWYDMLELNRMAFDDELPRNSESRAIAVAIKLIKKNAPQIKWILSFADGTQCGDGTIYRASGFELTQIRPNKTIYIDDNGNNVSRLTVTAHRPQDVKKLKEWELLDGYMLRYVKVIDPRYHIVKTIPYSAIQKMGAGMYKGEKR